MKTVNFNRQRTTYYSISDVARAIDKPVQWVWWNLRQAQHPIYCEPDVLVGNRHYYGENEFNAAVAAFKAHLAAQTESVAS